MLFKVLDDVGLFSRHECWVINSFFDLPDFLKRSSPDKADVYKEIAWWEWITCGTWLPARTQPNIVSYAVGEPRVPLRQPCFITSLNTSTPKSMSTWSSLPNSRSESCSPDKCFQLGCAEICMWDGHMWFLVQLWQQHKSPCYGNKLRIQKRKQYTEIASYVTEQQCQGSGMIDVCDADEDAWSIVQWWMKQRIQNWVILLLQLKDHCIPANFS